MSRLLCLTLAAALLLATVPARALDLEADLRGQSLMAVAHKIAQEHPEAARQFLVNLINLIPDEAARAQQVEEVDRALAAPGDAVGACILCRVVFTVFRVILNFIVDYETVEEQIVEYCEFLLIAIDQRINARETCKVVYIQGPHVAKIISSTGFGNIPGVPVPDPRPSVEKLCLSYNICYDPVDPSDVLYAPNPPPSLSQGVETPKTRRQNPQRPPKAAKKGFERSSKREDIITVAQVTDIHIENDYAADANEDCGLYVCCKEKQGPGNSGFYGSYQCNAPMRTARLFLEEVKKQNPDYVIFSGDIPPHTLWEETMESQLDCTRSLTSVIREILPGYIVYPSIGNHEMYPTNLFSVGELNETKNMVREFGDLWQDLAGFAESQITSMNSGGYYHMLAANHPRLRILATNTNYMYTDNFYYILNDRPGIQAPFASEIQRMKTAIIQMLNIARLTGEKVIVVNHHPPGGGDFIVAESKWYEQIMINYKDVVVLQVAGHTHTDEFRLLKDVSNNVESMVYVSPSIDMNHFRNPSIRVYHLNATTFELLDYDQFYFDLACATGTTPPEIVHLYSAREAYGLTDMKPQTWENLLHRFSTDQELLQKHRRHSYAAVGGSGTETPCDEACQRYHVCRQLHANYDHYVACVAGPPLPPGPTSPSPTWPPLERPTSPGPNSPRLIERPSSHSRAWSPQVLNCPIPTPTGDPGITGASGLSASLGVTLGLGLAALGGARRG